MPLKLIKIGSKFKKISAEATLWPIVCKELASYLDSDINTAEKLRNILSSKRKKVILFFFKLSIFLCKDEYYYV